MSESLSQVGANALSASLYPLTCWATVASWATTWVAVVLFGGGGAL